MRHDRPSENELGERRKTYAVRLHVSTVRLYKAQAKRLGLGRDVGFLYEDAVTKQLPKLEALKGISEKSPKNGVKESFGIKMFPALMHEIKVIAVSKGYRSTSQVLEECLLRYLPSLKLKDEK